MSQVENWTFRNLRSWTASFLEKKGADSPLLETEILLAHAAHTTRVDLFMRLDETPDDATRAAFRELVRRRGMGEPVAYLIGKKEFYALDFDVDSNVLVPRPETEQLALEAIEYIKKRAKTFGKSAKEIGNGSEESESADAAASNAPETWNICDVGVGSGCISVALAKHVPNARIVAIDLSASALDVAKKNAEKHGVGQKIEFVQSDLFAAFRRDLPEEARFDMIVSNPPYVSEAEYAALEPTVKNFEPELALVGGPTGAELPIRLVEQAAEQIKSGGRLFLELSPTTVHAVAERLAADGRWQDVAVKKDFGNLERFVFATRK